MEENKRKKSTKYLLIGVLVLFLSVLGASVAYYLARVSGSLSGRAAGTELAINVEKLSSKATGDLIPLDNDLETLNLAVAGYDNKGACVDINGYSVCQIYHITLTNKGSVPLTVNGTVTLSGQNVPNIDCATMTNSTTVASNNSCMGQNVFVSGDTLPANDHKDYYVMVYIKNLEEPQYDSGAFNGTVTFTTEDGRKVKGRFTPTFNLAQYITNLYTTATKSTITNNQIDYSYAPSVNLMNDRLGGTSEAQDSGNIRYYGAEPNNWIDIGDKTEIEVTQGNWVPLFGDRITSSEQCEQAIASSSEEDIQTNTGMSKTEFCSISTIPAGTPILWRIIGVFDEKLRIRRDENFGNYSYDTSASTINDGNGINEWSQADLMKLLNPGYDNNQNLNKSNETITVNNSLWWNSQSGICYKDSRNGTTTCDFTNTGLSEQAKQYVVDQTLYLGGFNTAEVFANEAWRKERGNDVFTAFDSNYNDNITRTLSWTGKVGLIYPSDFGYAADFSNSNCQGYLSTFTSCTANWMAQGLSWTISPWSENTYNEMNVYNGNIGNSKSYNPGGGWPTLLLDSSVLAESGNGSRSTPYVLTS